MAAETGHSWRLPAGGSSAALAAAMVATYAWTAFHGSPADPAELVRFGALERSHVWSGQVYRLVTTAFLHANLQHLLMNIAGLLLAGRPAEKSLGSARFLAVFFASVVGGSALSLAVRDIITVGASAGVFGVFGSLLVLREESLGGWGPFFRSGKTWVALVLLAATGLPSMAPLGWRFSEAFPTDELAHAGGFLFGFLLTLASTAQAPRRRPVLVVVSLLLALVGAAIWPRPGLTAYQGRELLSGIHAALRATDPARAAALIEQADRGGFHSESLDLYRALTEVQRGELEEGLVGLRLLAQNASPALRDEAKRQEAGVAQMLGYEYYTGDGRPKDPWRGLAYFEESCALGEEKACDAARRIRGETSSTPPSP